MPDISSIAIGLSSLKTAIEITKELRNVDVSFKDAEVKLKLAELIEALSETKIQLSEVRDENLELNLRIKELEKIANKKDEVEFRNGHYFLKNPSDGESSGPFCPNCYSDIDKLIPVSTLPPVFSDLGKFKCPKCRSITT